METEQIQLDRIKSIIYGVYPFTEVDIKTNINGNPDVIRIRVKYYLKGESYGVGEDYSRAIANVRRGYTEYIVNKILSNIQKDIIATNL